MSANVEVIGLTKETFRVALENNTYWKENQFSALSKNKATWILNSPRLEEHDYCLFLGLADNEMVAFIHVLPDLIIDKNGVSKKAYWMIEWWVSAAYKNTVLSTYLFSEALRFTNKAVLIKAYAESANAFYKKQPFQPLLNRTRFTIFFGLNPGSLIGKFKFLRYFRVLLNHLNLLTFSLISTWNLKKIKKSTAELTYEYLNQIDNSTWEFMKPFCALDVIEKTKDYVNWQLDPNQYLNIPVPSKFNFTSQIRGYSQNITLQSVKILKGNTIVGFISFLNFDDEVYLKYFVTHEDNLELITDVLIEHLISAKASHIFTENQALANIIKKRFITLFTHTSTKKAIAHKTLYTDMVNLEIKEQDGHFL